MAHLVGDRTRTAFVARQLLRSERVEDDTRLVQRQFQLANGLTRDEAIDGDETYRSATVIVEILHLGFA